MEIDSIKTVAISLIGILLTFITCIIKVIKKNKIIKKNTGVLSVLEVLENEIKEAEKNINYTGAEKKNYVITRVTQYMIENNLKYSPEEIINKLEELISLTKEVNVKTKEDWLYER